MTKISVNWIGVCTIVRRDIWHISDSRIRNLFAPWVSALLFIFVFGSVLGDRFAPIEGHRYLEFIFPGVLVMNIANAAVLQSSAAIYVARFYRYTEEVLVTPMSYLEMILGGLGAVAIRTSIMGIGVFSIGIVFGATHIGSWFMFLFWIVSITIAFGLLGMIIGLCSRQAEEFLSPLIFLTPLSMIGGIFNTVSMLPSWLRWLAYGNPLFYFISGIRGAMIGVHESPTGFCVGLTLAFLAILSTTTWWLYAKSHGLRD
jgi:ABC-2 type transport system permease protein